MLRGFQIFILRMVLKQQENLKNQYDLILEQQPTSDEKLFKEVERIVGVFDDGIDDLSNQLKEEVETEANKVSKKLIEELNYTLSINEILVWILRAAERLWRHLLQVTYLLR